MPTYPYSWLRFDTARTELANRLGDPNKVFWTDTELGIYIVEALRTWNSYTSFYLNRDFFSSVAGQIWYDASYVLASLRGYNVTDLQLLTEIEYHLMEPPTGATWSGSEMFTVTDILTAIQRRRDQFLNETGCTITQGTVSVAANPAAGRVALTFSNFDIIDLRRLAWVDIGGSYTLLWREDSWSVNSFYASRPGSAPAPVCYSISTESPLTVQLFPSPSSAGELETVTVNTGSTLDGSGVLLGIPDDFTFVVKWGALADLLRKDGPARDPARAKYCEDRWAQGIILANMPTLLVNCYINGEPANVESVFDFDTWTAGWQNTSDQPTTVGMAGLNLMALNPVPDDAYTVQADFLRNMPVPVADSDDLQIGREMWDVICGYAEHLAAFKMAGAEFVATEPNFEQFLRIAMEQNGRLRANEQFVESIHNRANREAVNRPRITNDPTVRTAR